MRTVRTSPSGPVVETVTELEAYDPAFASTDGLADLGDGTLTGFFRDVGDVREIQQLIAVGSTTNFGNGIMIVGLPPDTVIDMDKVLKLTSVPADGIVSGLVTVIGNLGGTIGITIEPTTPPRAILDLSSSIPTSGLEVLFQLSVPVVQS